MKSRFNPICIFVGCVFFSIIYPSTSISCKAEGSLKVEPGTELKKGNLLIGLKQYLGGENDNFSNNNYVTFSSDDGFLTLQSSNGIKYNSKKINIFWKVISLKKPYKIERIVFGPFSSYESAQKKANDLRHQGIEAIVTNPNDWQVWVDSKAELPDEIVDYKIFKKVYKTKITPLLNHKNSLQILEGPIRVSSEADIKINNINYGNNFYLTQDSYGTWTLIQKIKFDNYLEGVLPHEIGPNSPLEALKAQAVIARTWAIYNSERFNMDKYHLCITTQCQVYKPPKVLNEKVKKAINETSSQIVTFNNQPINSFYHGTNGGISSTASESWEIEDHPYLQPILDGSESLNQKFILPMHNKNMLNKFLDFKKESFYGHKHYLFRWDKKISSSVILDQLIKNKITSKNANIDQIIVSKRGQSSRVTQLKIKINGGHESIILEKDNIRKILNFLQSTLFIINKLNDDLWLFKGGGFGHGVGLSQSGAIEMAELGFTYEQILSHYYQGTKIRKIEILSQ